MTTIGGHDVPRKLAAGDGALASPADPRNEWAGQLQNLAQDTLDVAR